MEEKKDPKAQEIQALISKAVKKVREKYKEILQKKDKAHADEIKEIKRVVANLLNEAKTKIDELERELGTQDNFVQQLKGQLQAAAQMIRMLKAAPWSLGRVIKVLQIGQETKASMINAEGHALIVDIVHQELIPKLKAGQEVVLSQNLAIIGLSNILTKGEIAKVGQLLDNERILLETRMDDKTIVYLSEELQKQGVKVGDSVRWDQYTKFALEKVEIEGELKELELEQVPDVTFEQIGGLGPKIAKIKKEFIWPIIYREVFEKYKCHPIKGGILTGPPGCGKTLIAKALANYMVKLLIDKMKQEGINVDKDVKGYFCSIAGPQLSSKWVGETERMLRELFKKAREKGKEGRPVVIFFDEVESFLRTRGSGISSDVKDDYVTQFNTLLDGMTEMKNVLVLAATNRPDMVDPAVMREGRLDLKLEINRPDKEGTKDIFRIYLTSDIPLHPNYKDRKPEEVVKEMINKATDLIFAKTKETEFMEVSYAGKPSEILYFSDFISGAMIKGIVDRTKSKAISREISKQGSGITEEDLLNSIREIYYENKHLVNVDSLKQEFVLRPGEIVTGIKSLIEEKVVKEKKGELKKEKPTGVS